jgi:hypothetical protein
MRQLSYTAPDQLRCRLKGLPIKEFTALASLGRRVLDLEDEIAGIDELLDELVTATAPEML